MALIVKRRFNPALLFYFKLKPNQKLPPGLTDDLLAELYDLINKFGIKREKEILVQLSINMEIKVSGSTEPGDFSLMISRNGKIVNPIFCQINGPGSVTWAPELTVEEVELFIATIDEMMAFLGSIDKVTGQRIQTNFRTENENKLSTAEIFAEVGTIVPVFAPGQEEHLRSAFDEPDQVAIIDGPPFSSIKVLCHVRDLDYMRIRAKTTKKVFEKHGLRNTESIAKLTPEELVALKAEIKAEINN